MYYSARISYSTCIIDLLVIIIEMNLFQLASNKNIKKNVKFGHYGHIFSLHDSIFSPESTWLDIWYLKL